MILQLSQFLPCYPSPPSLHPTPTVGPHTGALGYGSASLPTVGWSGLSVRECGAAGSASGQTACPVSPTLCQSRSTTATRVLSSLAARLRPSYRSGWMFIFYFLGVGLSCCWIFYQFWLCEEAQCVYLCRHLGSSYKILKRRICCPTEKRANNMNKQFTIFKNTGRF